MCNISIYDYPISYYDALSYGFNNNIWKDKISQNHIKNGNKDTVKLGYLDKIDKYYLYGNAGDSSIIFPSSLNLYYNYTILYIAKYNGNDKGIIFSSYNQQNWISGFYDNNIDVAYHLSDWITNINDDDYIYNSEDWMLSIDQLNLFRSQKITKSFTNQNHTEITMNKNEFISWGINVNNNNVSDWSIMSMIILPTKQLNMDQIECLE
eukprot:20255_1